MEIAEFLLARIGEDEEIARDAIGHSLHISTDWEGAATQRHIYRWSSARVLAECETKRRIVEEHRPIPCENARHPDGLHCVVCSYDDIPKEWHPCVTLRLLALPCADHPDYQQEWRP